MKTIIILSHPNIDNSNANKALIDSLPVNANVTVHNIYKEYPDWNIDAMKEQLLLEAHDRIILQFPLYWFNCPPLLKKWIDEVFAYGWCYGEGGSKLNGKELGIALTTGGPGLFYQSGEKNLFTINEYMRPFQGIANTVGAKYLPNFITYAVMGREVSGEEKTAYYEYLTEIRKY